MRLDDMPEEYVTCKGKKYVIINGGLSLEFKGIVSIKEIKGLDRVTSLQELHLCNNQLMMIDGLDQSVDLEILDLSSNQIMHVDGLGRLKDLQELDLHGNFIERIEGIDSLFHLKKLDLFGNRLASMQGLRNAKLQVLDLHSNRLARIEGLDVLDSLKQLDLGANKISKIEGLESTIQLRKLSLFSNHINRIENLERLAELQELDLHDNEITRIEGLNHLKELKVLDLSSNQIDRVEGLEKLNNLEKLRIGKNLIPKERVEALGGLDIEGYAKDPAAFIKYCENQEKIHENVALSHERGASTITVPLNFEEIRKMAFEISASKRTYDEYIWLWAAADLRLASAYRSKLGGGSPSVEIDATKVIEHPLEEETRALAKEFAAWRPKMQEVHWFIAERQYIFDYIKSRQMRS